MKELILFLSVAIVVLSGCGKGVVGTTSVDPAFQAVADDFNQEASDRGLGYRVEGLSIQFGETSGTDVLGSCTTGFFGRQIIIRREAWDGATDSQREQLMFHEFGHCILNRPHTTQTVVNADVGDFVPVSIMTPDQIPDGIYEAYRSAYVDELFENAN